LPIATSFIRPWCSQSCLKLTAADRSIAAVPLGHVTGVVANIMTMVRCAGALIIMAEFKAAEYLKMAARERVTYTVMVPAMYNLCLLQPDFDSYDLSSWRIGGFGGAPMPIATIEEARRQNSRTEAGELLRRDRDHVALDHDARRTDRQPHRQCRPAVSGRADRRHGCRWT
jgi:acyl-CoA synthetase (AMP-forming)/AMP-acid ligase II